MHILVLPSQHLVVERAKLAGIFQYEQAKALSRAGHQVGIISVGFITLRHAFHRYPYHLREKEDTLTILRRYRRSALIERLVPVGWNQRRYADLFRPVYAAYENECGRPDVVHAHGFFHAGALASYLWDAFGIPFVLTEHSSAFARGLVSSRRDAAIFETARRAKVLSCVSSSFKEMLEYRVGRPFRIIPNLFDHRFVCAGAADRQSAEFTFLAIGSLDENKNHAILVRAFAAGFRGTSVRLRIGGAGRLRSQLERLVRVLGVESQVSFLGSLTRAEVQAEMRAAHCFVHPSNYETFGVVVIEALASGIPVVSTRCGGPEDVVSAENGLLVEVGNEAELRQAMEMVRVNHARYRPDTLRADVEARFGEARFVGNALSMYNDARLNV